jgi:predicted nucleic acid-binding protein
VREKIPKIAHNHDVDADQLFAQWEKYKTYVDFRKVSDEEIEAVRRSVQVTDEDDLPFVALQVDLGSLLTSDDDHVRDMGEAVSLKAIMALRDYSRAATVEHHLKVGRSS